MHSVLLMDNNTLLMGGLQNYVCEVDLNTVQETQRVRGAELCFFLIRCKICFRD